MSIATQIERLQGVRDQIRTKMVGLGLSENTDLLQNLADDLDGVNKISPTNNGTSDPGTGYTNVDTLSRSTSTRYIKIPKGYNDADRKFTVSGVANGAYSASVASHTTTNATASSSVTGSITAIASTTKPSGNDSADYFTITPKLVTASGSSKATGKATIGTAGYLATGNTTSSESSKSVGVTATQGGDYYLKSSSVSVGDPGVDPGTNYSNKATVNPTAEGDQYVKITAGYLSNSKITFKKMPEGSYSASVSSHTVSNATASSSVTGSVTGVATTTKPSGTDGTDYYTITPELTTGAGSSKATGKATVDTAGYLLAGNQTSSESSKTVEVTASQGSSYYLKAGSYSASVASHTTSNATASSNVSGSIVNVTSATKPSGTDGSDYFTITPTLTTSAGSSKATGKATVDAAGYLATGNTTSTESSKSVGVTADQGDNYYLKASSVTKEKPGVDPGNRYGNRATVDPSMVDQYVKITGGYLSDSKITIKKMTEGSVSSATTTDPGTENQTTVTPSLDKQYVKISAGHLPHSKITVEAIPNQKKSSDVSAEVSASISNITSIDASQVTSGVTVTASASGNMTVPLGYYSSAVTSTPTDSASTTIKPTLAGTNSDGAVSITASTTDIVKTSAGDYSNGFITKVTVSPTPSEEQTATPSNTTQTVTPKAGKLLSKVTVNAIPSPYFNTSGVTATASTVLKDYKFVNSSGTTVTGTIATATSSNVSGSVSGSDPEKITLTTEKTSGSSSTTATASATVAKGLYTGSSNIEKSLTSETITATAEAKLAASVTGSTTVPSTLPSGTVTITPNTDNVKRIYSDSKNKGFMTGVVLEAMPTGSYSASVASHDITNATASSSVTGSITSIASTTTPSGTDGTDYYTITPELTTIAGSSKATGKATISTAGYLSVDSDTSPESSKSVEVEDSPGKNYYLKASSVTKEKPDADPGTSYANKATVTPSTSTQYVKVTAGYLPNSKITVNAIPSPYFDTSGVTATAGTVLKDYKFVNSSGTTVTGTIATATSSNVSGSVSGSNPEKITLTTENTSKSSTTTATASATVTKGLYTGSSDITKSLTSKDFTATAEAKLAASVTGSTTVPSTLPSGTVTITPNTDNTKRIYSDSTNKGFITNVVVDAMSSATYTDKGTTDPGTSYANKLTISPSGTAPKYIQITKGHTSDGKITINQMSAGSVSSATTTDPGTDYANKATVTPSTSTQYVKVSAGYLPNSKVTVNAIPSTKITLTTSGWSSTTDSPELGSYTQTVTVTGVTASNKVIVAPDSGGDADVNGLLAVLYGVYAYSQAANSLTFRAFNEPTESITYVIYYFS